MFQSPSYVARRQGKNALSRFEYLQRLVTEFQDSEDLSVQQQVRFRMGNLKSNKI